MYKLAKPLLFKLEPERIHTLSTRALSLAANSPGALRLLRQAYTLQDKRLEVTRFGLTFPNPVGLAAGLDKNARGIPAWFAMNFGFVEVGSVTALSQPGNPQPRLFRLPQDEAIINRMGFNNDGAVAVARRLEQLFSKHGKPAAPLGINIGKSKAALLENAAADYLTSLELLYPFGDYFVINVSSPNTPGLRELQDKDKLERLLGAVQGFVTAQNTVKPVLVKIAPDLSLEQLDEVLKLALRYNLAGIIATNTTLARAGLKTNIAEAGGLSGRPLRQTSLEFLKHIRHRVGDSLPIISVGGVASAEDAIARLLAGACLIQTYTGLVYEGPGLAKAICKGLLATLEQKHIATVEMLIGQQA